MPIFKKIVTFFAMVENSTYIVYNTLRGVTFMGTNKILSQSLHSRDFAKFHLIKFNLLNF